MSFSSRRNTLLAIAISALSGVVSAQTSWQAAGWPSKTVRLVVGFPAGSSPDLTARALAEPLSKALGKPVIVENKVGAGGNIGADFVAKATDKHTLGLMINGNLTTAKLLNPKLPYDPLKDLQPVSLIGVSPLVLMAPKNAPGLDAAAFFAAAKLAGDTWSYGSPGVGTVGHIGMELLNAKTGMKALHVPYPDYAQVALAMVGGQLQLSMLPPALVQPRTGGVVGARRQQHRTGAFVQRGGQCIGPHAHLVDLDAYRLHARQTQGVDGAQETGVFHCHLVAGHQVRGGQALDGVHGAVRQLQRPACRAVRRKPGLTVLAQGGQDRVIAVEEWADGGACASRSSMGAFT